MVQAETVLKDLRALWRDLGSQEHNPGGVLRACAITLIVLTEDAEADPIGETLALLMKEHPSRAIVVRVNEGAQEPESRVFAQCWMPFGKRQQICCEQIEIRTGVDRLNELDPVLLAIAAPDLPIVMWCRGKRWLDRGPWDEVLPLASKLVFDTKGAPTRVGRLRAWDQKKNGCVADLEWTRLTPWRELIAQAFSEPEVSGRSNAVKQVTVRYGVDGRTSQVEYLSAWVREALPQAKVTLEQTGASCGLASVRFAGDGVDIDLTRGEGEALRVRVGGRDQHNPCPERTEADLLEEELKILGSDRAYRAALISVAGL
jgi:glucose-6-phosphate dehydrogenase assembly protein OpcA